MNVFRVVGHDFPWADMLPNVNIEELANREVLFVASTQEQALAWSCHLWNGLAISKYVLIRMTVRCIRDPQTLRPTDQFRTVEELNYPEGGDAPFFGHAPECDFLRGATGYMLQDAIVFPEDVESMEELLHGEEWEDW